MLAHVISSIDYNRKYYCQSMVPQHLGSHISQNTLACKQRRFPAEKAHCGQIGTFVHTLNKGRFSSLLLGERQVKKFLFRAEIFSKTIFKKPKQTQPRNEQNLTRTESMINVNKRDQAIFQYHEKPRHIIWNFLSPPMPSLKTGSYKLYLLLN